ncbi:hypothetical protein, partial [Stenotrophomonas sp.]|uniref:hypothetical protein n=1 Tax=Stenotrophomonas sp. TaxID=69392 RepID=UPI003C679739
SSPTVTTPAGISDSNNIKVVPAADNLSGIYELSIGGTATMDYANTNDRLDANTEYKVRHLVTCMQNGTSGQCRAVAVGKNKKALTGVRAFQLEASSGIEPL